MKPPVLFLAAALVLSGPAFICNLWAQENSEQEDEALDFAQGLLVRGMYDMAQTEYQKFLDTYSQSLRRQEASLGLAESRFLAKDFAKATEMFTQFKQSYPQSEQLATAVLRLAQIHLEQKNYDEALKALGSMDLQKLKWEMAPAFNFYLGQVYRNKGDLTRALDHFQKSAGAADSGGYAAAALQSIAEVHVQNNRYKEAAEAYGKALPLVQEDSLKGYLFYRLGEAQFLAGNYADAIAQFQQVLDQYAQLDITKDAMTNLLLARFNLGQYDYLLAVYKNNNSLLKEDPSCFEAHVAAVKAYFELKDYDQALVLINKILSWPGLSDEQKQKVTVTKAAILVKKSQYKEGVALLKDSGAASAGSEDERDFVQAQSYYGLGDFQKAAEAFGNIFDNHPNSSYAKAALLGRAHALQETGDYLRAGEFFLKYYERESGDQAAKGEALYLAALMEVKANGTEHAVDLAKKYLAEFPQGSYREQTILLLANVYAGSGQPDQAIALLQEQLGRPDSIQDPAAFHFLLGYNQQLSGQTDQALQTYAKVPRGKDQKFYASALKNSAAIHLERNNPAEAAAVYERLISELDKNTLELKTYIWLCNEYLKEKKFKGVLRVAAKAEEYFLNQSRQELAYFKAEASRALQDYEQARKFYDVVFSDPQKGIFSGAAHIGSGLNFMAVAKFAEAQKEFQKALEENADDQTITLRARFELANALMSQNKTEEALRFYLLVGTIYDDTRYCPQAMLKAAGILETLGRKPEALKVYQDILARYKNSTEAATARDRLTLFLGPIK